MNNIGEKIVNVMVIIIIVLLLSPFLFFVIWKIFPVDWEKSYIKLREKYRIMENVIYLEPNIEYYSYYDRNNDVILVNDDFEKTIDFEIFECGIGDGFYHYYVWLNNINEAGVIYLKAFEYNTNNPLRLSPNAFFIDTYHFETKKYGPVFFVNYTDFISEYYLAKFELWFSPGNTDDLKLMYRPEYKYDQKILIKVYKVKGFID